jgi:hypothetical protein
MADTDLPKDAAKILQKAADQTRNTGKAYELTADQIKILVKAFNSMQDAASSVSNEIRKSKKTVDDAIDSFTHFQEKLIEVGTAFENPKRTLRGFADLGLSTGDDLMKMYSALGGMVFSKPIKDATKSVQDLENQLKELQDLEAKANPVKALEESIKKEEELCKKTTACNKDRIKSLQDQLTKGKDQNKLGGSLTDIEKDRLKTLRDQKPELERGLDLAKGHLGTLQGLIGGYQKLLAIFGDAFDRFVELDKAAEDFRNETGLNKTQMKDVETAARQVNQELAGFGVSIKDSYKAAQALGEQFGSIQNVSKEQIKTVALLNTNLGVTNENAAGFLQKMESIGGLTEQQANGMAGLAASAATAAGVPLDKVMHDVANASDTTLAMMKGNVRQMTLAAIQAQRMGVNLEKTASAARGLLNFQESVDAEMEASVLLGKSLNLNYARQLSFQGDIAGAQKEVVNQVRSMGEFSKMNVFQQEALAKATGYSVADLSKMMKNEEKLSKLKPDQVKAYEKATKALKEQTEETGLQMLQQAQMQGTMTQLSNTFKSFKQSAADALTPLVMIATKILVPVLKTALVLFNAFLLPVKLFGNLLYKLFEDWKLGELMDYVSGKLDVAVQYIEKFSQWTEDAEHKSGMLLTVFKGIGAAVGAVMVSMYLFPTALTGIRTALMGLKSLIGKVFTLPSFGKFKLPSFGAGGAGGASKIGDIFKNLKTVVADVFSSILNIIKNLGKAIGGFVSDLAKGIGSAISSIASGIGSAMGAIGKGVGAALQGIGQGLRVFADPTVAVGLLVVTAAAIAFGLGIALALRIATPAIKVLADMLVKLAPFLVAVFVPAINAVKEVILKLVDVMGGIYMTVINAVKEVVLKLAGVFGGIFMTAINAVKDTFLGLVDVIGGVLIKGLETMRDMFASLPNVVGAVANSLMTIASAAPGIGLAAVAIGGLAVSLLAMSAAMGGGVVGSVTGIFTGNPVSKLYDLSLALLALTLPADRIRVLGESVSMIFSNFSELDTYNSQLLIFSTILKDISKINLDNLNGLNLLSLAENTIFGGMPDINQVTTNEDTKPETTNDQPVTQEKIVSKLDELISLMSNGGIGVYLDGRKVSEQLAIASS